MKREDEPGEKVIEAPVRPAADEVVFVLPYDEEITYLVNEGVMRPGMLPSGFKDA